MPQGNVLSKMASGSILPYSFVKLDSATPFNVVQATANTDVLFGISSEAAYQAPIPQLSGTQYAADAGQMLKIYGPGCTDVLLKTTGCTAGDMLTSDASGNGVTTAPGAGKRVGAIALDTRASGELCRVRVVDPFFS